MRRGLLLAVVVVVGVVLLVFFVRGRGDSQSAVKKGTPGPSRTAVVRPGKTVKATPSPAPRDYRQEWSYAAQLVPIVDRSTRIFDAAAGRAAASSNLSQLGPTCGSSLPHIEIVQAQADGVPHPYPWYSPAGHLHHRLIGVYHAMVGAAEACQTDAANGQGNDASTSVTDMANASQALHRMDRKLHAMARKASH